MYLDPLGRHGGSTWGDAARAGHRCSPQSVEEGGPASQARDFEKVSFLIPWPATVQTALLICEVLYEAVHWVVTLARKWF